MREILFRGKRKDNNEWIEGYYAVQSNHACFAHELKYTHFIFKDIFLDFNLGGLQKFEVIPETVGQYTGLTDKNGKKIFEGDIVEGHCHSQWNHRLQRCVIVYDRDSFKSRHYLNYLNEEHYFEYKVLFSKDVVVIGNIHDNPKLLERSNGND